MVTSFHFFHFAVLLTGLISLQFRGLAIEHLHVAPAIYTTGKFLFLCSLSTLPSVRAS